jgi:acyl-homoserine lactone acylase PvdQ
LGYSTCLWKTDADAVFGMLYAQCEDDLRIEMNYIEKLGRLSEIKGNPFYIMIWKQD